MRFIDRFDILLLDMGNTFMFNADRFSENEDYFATYRALGGQALSEERLRRIIDEAFEALVADYNNPACYEHYPRVRHYLERAPSEAGLPEGEIELVRQVFARHEIGVIPPEHVEAIRTLAQNHRLGLVSNIWSDSDLYLRAFDAAGIRQAFEVIVFSSDIGIIKPSPKIFRKAIEAFGADPSGMVFIGDDPLRDIAGARGAGLAAIRINANGQPYPANLPAPDHVVADLRDLLEA